MSIFHRPHGYLHLRRSKEMGQSHRSIRLHHRCEGDGVLESTLAGVCVFQKEPEQDQEWIFLIRAGVIFS